MPRIGTNTNSNDPQSLRSRVFVGNIDASMSRDEIESIFQRYGSVSALSVHKGFAFVQYNEELSARAAVFGENNKKYYSKCLDCNVASEPKPNRKRAFNQMAEPCPQVHPYLAATAQALAAQTSAPSLAQPRTDYGGAASAAKFSRLGTDLAPIGTRASNLVSLVAQSNPPKTTRPIMPIEKEAPSKDILICGSCKSLFENYDTLINHKARGCRLRFICRCKQMGEPKSLSCSRCFLVYRSSWELLLHHVSAHGTSLFVDEERHCQAASIAEEAAESLKSPVRVKSVKVESVVVANGQDAGENGGGATRVPVTSSSQQPKVSREEEEEEIGKLAIENLEEVEHLVEEEEAVKDEQVEEVEEEEAELEEDEMSKVQDIEQEEEEGETKATEEAGDEVQAAATAEAEVALQ